MHNRLFSSGAILKVLTFFSILNLQHGLSIGGEFLQAAKQGNLGLLQQAVTNGMSLDTSDDKTGLTALHLASQSGHVDVVRWLVNQGANFSSLSNYENFNTAPIHLAAKSGSLDVVRYFIENVSSNLSYIKNMIGEIPIHYAAYGGQIEVMSFFLDKTGVNIEVKCDRYGRTPLHCASTTGNLNAVKWLVERDANVAAESTHYGHLGLPIHYAAKNCHQAVVQYYLKNFPFLKKSTTREGLTAEKLVEQRCKGLEYYKNLAIA